MNLPFWTQENDMKPKHLVILAIDDEPDTLRFISDALEVNDMSVMVATSGTAGIELARRVRPDVILLDAVMPVIDGFETCRRLKNTPEGDGAPIIFMTGLSDTGNVLKGLAAGGVDYITKPVNVEVLVARIITHALNAQAIATARAALDQVGRAVLAFTSDGMLEWGSASALALLDIGRARHLVEDDPSAAHFRMWVANLYSQPVSRAKPFCWDTLTFSFLGVASERIMVKLRAGNDASNAVVLSNHFSLTEREAEVLLWLTRGKTNQDIGEILGISTRTINKHLEQVFQKMGVENRTAAALLADRLLYS